MYQAADKPKRNPRPINVLGQTVPRPSLPAERQIGAWTVICGCVNEHRLCNRWYLLHCGTAIAWTVYYISSELMVRRLPSMKNDTSLLSVTTERKTVFTVDLSRCPSSVITAQLSQFGSIEIYAVGWPRGDHCEMPLATCVIAHWTSRCTTWYGHHRKIKFYYSYFNAC